MIQPTRTLSVRESLMATASHRLLTGLVAGLSITTLHAVDWNGSASQDWNTAANWTPSGVPNGANAVVKVATPNYAKISADMTGTPVDIIVGADSGANSRLDHISGTGNTGNGNWMFVGRNSGTGVYNLANTAGTGGTYTGFGLGSGTMNVKGRLYVSGNSGTGSTGTVRVNTSGTLAIGAHLEIATNTSTGSFLLDAGTVTVGDWMEIGNGTGCNGTFNMSGGTLTKGGIDGIIVAANGATGNSTITGGSINSTVVGGNGQFRVGNAVGSNGTLNLSGTGSINVTNEIWVGNNAATGNFNFAGGSVTNNNWVAIGRRDGTNAGGTGTVTMTGGTWTKTGDSNFIVGASGNGTMNMSGGIVDVGTSTVADRGVTWVGEQNNVTGLLTLSGTADFRTARITLAVNSGTTGTLNLDGGIARVGQITGGAGTETVHFNGTQLIARGNQAAFVSTLNASDVKTGGLKVDTNGFNVTIPQVLTAGSPSGGVVKTGAGTLTLTGANTYTGDHTISAGKLAVTNDHLGGGSFTVAEGAKMGVIQNNDIDALDAANVTFNGATGSSLEIDLGNMFGNPTVAPLNVTGTLTLNGPVTINVTDQLPAVGTVPLVSYLGSKAGTGSFVLGSLPNGVSATLSDNGSGLVSLNVLSVSLPTWDGNVNGNWNTTTANWFDLATNNYSAYTNPAPVVFDDSAAGTTDVILNATFSPSSVRFNNSSSKPYTLTGTGKISGATGLTKQSDGTASISTANDFTGPVTISGGTLAVSSIANGGSPSPLGASSSSASNVVLDGGTLAYTGAAASTDRGFTINALNTGISVTNELTLTGAFANAAGNFIKSGPGNLILTQNGPVALGTVTPGVEVREGTLTLTGSGAQVVTVAGQMYVGSTPNLTANLVLNNTTLNTGNFLTFARGQGNDGVTNFTATNSVINSVNFSSGYNNGLVDNASEAFLTLNNTTWTNTGVTYLSESTGSSGAMTLNGTSQFNAIGSFLLGRNAGTTAMLTLKDTTVLNKTAGYIGIGAGGIGTLNVQDSASLTSNVDDFNVGDGVNATGTINLSGNGSISGSQMYIGKNPGTLGTVNQTGGSFQSSTFLTIGRFAGGVGIVNVSAGTLTQGGTAQTLLVGQEGTGTLNISGTANVVSNGTALQLALAATGNGTVNLNGGTLTVKQVLEAASGGNSEFYFNGGTLKANTGANATFMTGLDAVFVKGGGATIDTNGQTIAIAQNLVDGGGNGGLTKTGTGTLRLNGSNSFTGTTTVSTGTLGGTGSIAGPLVVNAGASVAPGASAGTLTAGATTITGGYICEIDGATADKLAVNGALTISPGAVLDFNVLAAPTAPTYVIASYSSLTGTFTVQDLPVGYTVNYHYNDGVSSNNIALVSATATPYDDWTATYFPGVTDQNIIGPAADPDKDGSPNSLEFALGGVPNNGSNGPKVFQFAADGSDAGTEPELLLTIAVRGNPTFSAGPAPTATVDGFTYTVNGSLTLGSFTSAVSPVTPVAPPAPNAAPPAGYVWRTFSLDGSNNLPGKGFLRVSVN
ncbi:beta strand repeat-containing protein [Luteolibacter soli]|uniref:Autotransporter-associated beta strand repeat-containing protein n=1 Tax=Luteolibacter soli TaxID=3135280 RepID=A0ABU9ASS9_9BACT